MTEATQNLRDHLRDPEFCDFVVAVFDRLEETCNPEIVPGPDGRPRHKYTSGEIEAAGKWVAENILS